MTSSKLHILAVQWKFVNLAVGGQLVTEKIKIPILTLYNQLQQIDCNFFNNIHQKSKTKTIYFFHKRKICLKIEDLPLY